MDFSERIAITGMGAVCGAGRTVDEIFDAVINGHSAIRPITQWNPAKWPATHAAEVQLDDRALVPDRKMHKLISRTDMYGLYAADGAVRSAGLIEHREQLSSGEVAVFNDRSGIMVGSGGGTYRSSYDYLPLMTVSDRDLKVFGRELTNVVNPMWLLKNLPNNVLCYIGIRYNFKGTNLCITNHGVGGATAVAESAASLRAGEADRMTAVGHDAPFEPETVLIFHKLGLLAESVLRPFDRGRRGTILGEGAASVVLERKVDAKARGATILGELLGVGCVNEGSGVVSLRRDGSGAARAMQLALADADVEPQQVGLIVAHGNGNRTSDATEVAALRTVFDRDLPPITAFKWVYGNMIAASGIMDLVVTLRALREGVVPGIATLVEVDPELGPLPVSQKPQTPRSDLALIICRGFGGMNVALIVRGSP
ncbi:MAG: beta-ketoacyl-[acyl-carrier-protein] synthase family protein [Verrucomicrobia bacterium]|nr:beta-ketoacyl-[acyl-carrier-protein] synthase family protein [Verrucomicrobiota bacterium]